MPTAPAFFSGVRAALPRDAPFALLPFPFQPYPFPLETLSPARPRGQALWVGPFPFSFDDLFGSLCRS